MGSLRYGTEVDTVWDTTHQRGVYITETARGNLF